MDELSFFVAFLETWMTDLFRMDVSSTTSSLSCSKRLCCTEVIVLGEAHNKMALERG